MLTVGQVAENCFVIRRDGSDRGLIVDPGEEAERILHVVDELGLGIDAILSPTPTSTTSAPSRRWRRRPGRRSTAPRSRCRCSPTSWPTSPGRGSAPMRATTPTRRSPAASRLELAGMRDRGPVHPGPQPRPRHLRDPRRGGAVQRRRPLPGLGRARRPPGRRLADPAGEHPQPRRRLSRGDRGLSRPHGDHDARRRAGDESVPGRARALALPPMSRARFQAPRGTFDILPAEARAGARRLRRRGRAGRRGPATAGIETPIFEDTELFARGVGEGTDIVHKEMFTFTDQGDRSLTLRPEGTAAICRAYIEHGMHKLPQPVKLWYLGAVLPPRAPAGGALPPVPPARAPR